MDDLDAGHAEDVWHAPGRQTPSISRSALRAVLKNTAMASARISIGKVLAPGGRGPNSTAAPALAVQANTGFP